MPKAVDPVFSSSVLAAADLATALDIDALTQSLAGLEGKVDKNPKTAAIILAGGTGERFGKEGGKQLVEIGGKPILTWSVEAFDAVGDIGLIVIVCPAERQGEYLSKAVDPFSFATPIVVAAAGSTRQESAFSGLELVPEEFEYVVMHDGARPLISADLIAHTIATLKGNIDADGAVQMANRVFSELAADEGENAPDAAGRSLLSLFDVKTGALLVEAVRGVLQSGRTDTVELRMREGDVGERLLRVSLFPPYRGDGERGESRPGVVAIFQDITEFRRRSEQRQRQQANVMLALVRAIESVDPYLAGHSQKVAGLADLVGGQMGMDRASREGLRIAAALSQIGKLFIPRELLHKTGNLTPEERAEIMRAPEYAHDLLKDIDFGQPVAEAVYDMYEKLDGKGYPRGLSGESIPLASRVLGAVNTFCAMISPRSHREGLRREDAMDRLRKEPGFDPAVVEALDNVLRTPEGMSALLGG